MALGCGSSCLEREGEAGDGQRVIHCMVVFACVLFLASEGRRGSWEAAAQAHAADLVLELKCSTAVWLVSVP